MTDTGLDQQREEKEVEGREKTFSVAPRTPLDTALNIEEEPAHKAPTTEPTAQEIFAAAANPERFNFSAPSYSNIKQTQEQEEKRKRDALQTITQLNAQLDKSIENLINSEKYKARFEKSENASETERREIIKTAHKEISEQMNDDAKNAGLTEQEKNQKITDRLGEHFQENGQINNYNTLIKMQKDLANTQDIQKVQGYTRGALFINESKASPEDIAKAIETLEINTEGLSPKETEIAIFKASSTKSLESAENLLDKMKDTLKEFKKQAGTMGPFPEDFVTSQKDLEQDIKEQEFLVNFKAQIVKTIEEESPSWGNASQGDILDSIINKFLEEKPELLFQMLDDEDLQTKMLDAAKKAGIEDTSKIEEKLSDLKETIALSRETLKTIGGEQNRHDFLWGHGVKMALNQELLTYPEGDDGQAVYHDPKIGLYYVKTGDDGAIERVKYTDPLDIAKINAMAWDENGPKSFANELKPIISTGQLKGKGIDPENDFWASRERHLANEEMRKQTVLGKANKIAQKNRYGDKEETNNKLKNHSPAIKKEHKLNDGAETTNLSNTKPKEPFNNAVAATPEKQTPAPGMTPGQALESSKVETTTPAI